MPLQPSTFPSPQRRQISRRNFLRAIPLIAGTIAASPLLTSCGDDSGGMGGAGEFEFKLAWIPNAEYAGFFQAQQEGDYESTDIEPTFISGGPNSATIPLITGKRALGGIEAIPENAVNAINAGDKIKIVGSLFQRSPECWVSLADSPVKEPKDIEGKRLGITLAGRNTAIVFMESNNVDVSKVELVPIQFDPAPLISNEVDALWGLATNQPVTLELAGHSTHVMPLGEYGFNRMQNVIMVHEDTLSDEESAETMRTFLKSSEEGWAAALGDPGLGAQTTVDMYGQDLGLVLEEQTAVLEAMVPYMTRETDTDKSAFWMSDALIQETIDSLGSIGIQADPTMFTNELLS